MQDPGGASWGTCPQYHQKLWVSLLGPPHKVPLTGQLTQQKFIVPPFQRPEIKVSAGLFSSEAGKGGYLLGLQVATLPCVFTHHPSVHIPASRFPLLRTKSCWIRGHCSAVGLTRLPL